MSQYTQVQVEVSLRTNRGSPRRRAAEPEWSRAPGSPLPRGTATSRRGGGTRAGQSGRGSCPRRRPPRRRGGTPGEPAHRGVSGGLRPRQRAPNTLGRRRAGRARRRPPRMARRAGRRARTAGTLATRMATDRRETDPPPMPAPAAPPPGQATSAFHPVRQRTASGETAPRPPTARWRSCLLHSDGTTRPRTPGGRPPASGERATPRRHGDANGAAGHHDGEDTG